ncbi:hypothetical protein GCM10010191_52590 [Actinomadura vinacea]|uniref:PH domain-containing protein n=1 Tax=Actinomadura vinacea TaxID=115336 RepID=A0ABN3JLV9_9ACTN
MEPDGRDVRRVAANNEARARPGGRVRLAFSGHGYSADKESFRDRLERWGHRFFRDKVLFIALGLAILLSWPAFLIPKAVGASENAAVIVGSPALLCFCYFLFGILVRAAAEFVMYTLMILSLPLLVFGRYRRWLFGDKVALDHRPGFVHASHVAQAWAAGDGDRVTVTVRLSDGAQIEYAAQGDSGRSIANGFARLLGPRLVQARQ